MAKEYNRPFKQVKDIINSQVEHELKKNKI